MAGIDSFTTVMLHLDGADASTTFTDSSQSALTFTGSGNAQIDTAQSVFGGASMLLDGVGDYISTSSTSAVNMGTADFTIDFRVRFSSIVSFNWIFQGNAATNSLDCGFNTSNTVLRLFLNSSEHTFSWTPSQDVWYHVAFARNGTNLMAFVDGTQIGTTLTSSDDIPTSAFSIGTNNGVFFHYGWIDEFRVSKGIARWTANFTPPTEAYSADTATGNFFMMFR